MKGHKLDKVDFFGLSDPFLIFSRAAEDGTFVDVHKTEVRKFTLNPDWMPFSIKVNQLCNNDYERPIRIQCMDWNSKYKMIFCIFIRKYNKRKWKSYLNWKCRNQFKRNVN